MSSNIGFVGLGRMGANMARRLKDCGFSIAAVYDVQHSIAESLAEELGATASLTLAGVTALSDVVITVVPDDAAMHAIFTGSSDGLLINAQGRTFINCATVSPTVHLEVESAAEKAGARALEGCMASSITQAREGSLFLIVGGKREVFEATKPILEKLSTNLRYVGGAGEAAKVKALVNMVMNINTAALAEGLGLASALGMDLSRSR